MQLSKSVYLMLKSSKFLPLCHEWLHDSCNRGELTSPYRLSIIRFTAETAGGLEKEDHRGSK